jgi:hypothetical protein
MFGGILEWYRVKVIWSSDFFVAEFSLIAISDTNIRDMSTTRSVLEHLLKSAGRITFGIP